MQNSALSQPLILQQKIISSISCGLLTYILQYFHQKYKQIKNGSMCQVIVGTFSFFMMSVNLWNFLIIIRLIVLSLSLPFLLAKRCSKCLP